MAKFFPVSPAIWNRRVMDLGRDAALMYAYLLSCPHRGSEGLYRLPLAYVSADLDYTVEEVRECLAALEGEGLIKYDHGAEALFDPHALHFLAPRAEKQIKGAINRLQQVPSTPLLAELYVRAQQYVEELAEAMEKHFPELVDPPEQFPDTSETLSNESHRGRGRQLGSGLDSGIRRLDVNDLPDDVPLLKAQLERAIEESDWATQARIRLELDAFGVTVP